MNEENIKSNQSLDEDIDTLIKIGCYDVAQSLVNARISFLRNIY